MCTVPSSDGETVFSVRPWPWPSRLPVSQRLSAKPQTPTARKPANAPTTRARPERRPPARPADPGDCRQCERRRQLRPQPEAQRSPGEQRLATATREEQAERDGREAGPPQIFWAVVASRGNQAGKRRATRRCRPRRAGGSRARARRRRRRAGSRARRRTAAAPRRPSSRRRRRDRGSPAPRGLELVHARRWGVRRST